MLKKILAFVCVTILVLSMSAIPALAAPYNGGNTISGDKTIINAVTFDTDDYNDSTGVRAVEAGNWTWYYDARTAGNNYAHRPEYSEKEDGPQTENTDIAELGGNVGALCYTHDDEWVQYTLNVEVAGKYDVKVWASTDAGAGKIIDLSVGGKDIGSAEIQSKGWGTYNLHDVGSIDLSKGTNVMKLAWATGDVNVAAFEFTLLEAAPTEAPADDAAPADDNAAADNASTSTNDGESNSMILWIVIAAAAVVVIIIIVVLVTKKKK